MKVVIINNDLRVYWKDRLVYLQQYLTSCQIDFYAIELFGKGSPYSFDTAGKGKNWWFCLFPEKSSSDLSGAEITEAVNKALDDICPDVVIGSPIVFYAGALGIRWAKNNGKKFIMFDDARPWQVKRNFLVQTIKNLITQQADGLWFPLQRYYNNYPYFHNKNVHFFYGFNCVNNAFFKGNHTNHLNNNAILCVARLVPVKNIDTLFKAWQIVEEAAPHYRLTIIGNGPEYENLNSLKDELGLKNVDFLGVIDNSTIAEYYSKADAFILPSLSESWGLVVNEAMAAGLPVLLSNKVNAAYGLLKEGVNGFSFDPLHINEMADAILKVIKLSPQQKQAMSAKSLEIIDQMSYEKMGTQLTEALNIIMQKKTKKPGLLSSLLLNKWNGRNNTSGWDKL